MPFTTIQESGTKVIGNTTLIPQILHPDVMAASALASSLGNPFSRLQIDYANAFVNGCVAAGIWTKMKAVYLFMGGSANQHMINFKDARNLNAAYRLSFLGGGWTHDATGSTPNGTSSYADTFFNTSTSFTSTTNASMSLYSGTNSNGAHYDISNSSGGSGTGTTCTLIARYFLGPAYVAFGGSALASPINNEGRGFFLGNRNSGTSELWWARAGETSVSRQINTAQTWTRNNSSLYLSANNQPPGVPGLFSNKRLQFVHFGDTLTVLEIQIFRNLIQALQQSLSRAV